MSRRVHFCNKSLLFHLFVDMEKRTWQRTQYLRTQEPGSDLLVSSLRRPVIGTRHSPPKERGDGSDRYSLDPNGNVEEIGSDSEFRPTSAAFVRSAGLCRTGCSRCRGDWQCHPGRIVKLLSTEN